MIRTPLQDISVRLRSRRGVCSAARYILCIVAYTSPALFSLLHSLSPISSLLFGILCASLRPPKSSATKDSDGRLTNRFQNFNCTRRPIVESNGLLGATTVLIVRLFYKRVQNGCCSPNKRDDILPETCPICAIIEFECSIQSDVDLALGRQRDKSTGERILIPGFHFDRESSHSQELVMGSKNSES